MTVAGEPAAPQSPSSSAPPSPPRGIRLSAVLQLALSSLLVTAAELLLKTGATREAAAAGRVDWTGLDTLWGPGAVWVWLGVIAYTASLLLWLSVLRSVPLIVAFNLMNVVHVLIPLGAWVILGEEIPPVRMVGIALIIAGITALAGPLAKLEEKL